MVTAHTYSLSSIGILLANSYRLARAYKLKKVILLYINYMSIILITYRVLNLKLEAFISKSKPQLITPCHASG